MKQKLFENIGGNTFKLMNDQDEHDRIDPDQRWDKVPPVPHNPSSEESSEVQIGKQILAIIEEYLQFDLHRYHQKGVDKLTELAQNLIRGVK